MTVERYPRSARRYHTAIYVVTLVLLATGWWLLAGREGDPSPIAQLTGVPDAEIHTLLGWALLAVAVLPLPFTVRGVVRFVVETFRYDRGDLRWLLHLPAAIVTGRFPRHEGHFDPGQRIANVAIVGLLVALVVSGVGLVLVHVGPLFAILAAIHRVATVAFTIVIVGHVIVALGILPGYHGVWRSMHLGGRLRLETARRLWPGWTDREGVRAAILHDPGAREIVANATDSPDFPKGGTPNDARFSRVRKRPHRRHARPWRHRDGGAAQGPSAPRHDERGRQVR